jgi:inorganic triphosphatase YgiF
MSGKSPDGTEMTMVIEREVKLSAASGFRVPTLDDAVAGLHCGSPVELHFDATYFDAADIRLGRMGITLRHRSGEGGPRGRWTLKVPVDPDATGSVIARHEIIKDAASQPPPADLVRVVRAVLRGAELIPVTRLQTTRRMVPLHVGDVHVGELCDDAVTVIDGRRVRARFRELEIEETANAPEDVLDATVGRLRAAGA